MAEYVTTPNILWTIENFSSVCKKLSPTTVFMGLKYQMSFSQYIEAGGVKFQLNMIGQNGSQTKLDGQLRIEVAIYHNNSRYLSKSGNYNLSQHNDWCIWTDFLTIIYKNLGQVNAVTFLVMITPTGDFRRTFCNKEVDEEIGQIPPCAASLSEDIGSLFNDSEHSDFVLKCGDKMFFVHKAILSSRSDFFAGMFRCDMKEVNEKEGKLENIDPDILEIVLRYLYTGELPQLPMDSVQKVYAAADRFIVDPLKKKCHSLLIDNFVNESERNLVKQMESEQPEFDQHRQIDEAKRNDVKERQMLKDLFINREWRSFSEEFPDKAHEMCKPFLLEEL